jgi:hypothetical protein
VAGVAGAAADAEDEEPPFAFAQRRKFISQTLDFLRVDLGAYLGRFADEIAGMHGLVLAF